MYADLNFENVMLKDILTNLPTGREDIRLSENRDRSEYLVDEYDVSVKRSCSLVSLSRSMWYYES